MQCDTITVIDESPYIFSFEVFKFYDDPGVNSASNRNEYQEHFLGVKAAVV